MPRSLSKSTLTTLLTAQIALTSVLGAYEQSSYYIFDLVDSDTSEPTMGRLVIPAQAITAGAIETVPTLPESQGEFVIDFEQALEKIANSSFVLDEEIGDLDSTDETESVSFSTETFDFGTSTTVFGD